MNNATGDISLIKKLESEIGSSIEIQHERLLEEDSSKYTDDWHYSFFDFGGIHHGSYIREVYANFDGARQNSKLAIINNHECVIRLYLNSLPIKEIPNTLFEFKELEVLCLYNNEFNLIPSEIKNLHALKALNIESNSNLRELPLELADLPRLEVANFWDLNSLYSPPKNIAYRGLNAVRNYFESLGESDGIDYLYEAKMVFVGRGSVGKSSLVRKITVPGYQLEEKIKSTEGIEIGTCDLKISLEKSDRFRFNIWDFAGQEKYDATHQFFITERTLYLFVTEARQESNYLDFDYWLNIIQILGNSSPVIVVQNKVDQRRRALPSDRYSNQFPNIVEFVNTSCADGYEHTIDMLMASIKDATKKLPQLGDKLPSKWVAIRKELEDLDVDHISYQEYRSICSKYKLDQEKADYLSRYFNDLGVIVHYKDSLLLKNFVVVNPDWAVDGAYSVLDASVVEENYGHFNDKDLEEIWSDRKYSSKRPELLELMKNYELCFELPDKGNYIAPELLPANPVNYKPINSSKKLIYIYSYQFMPAGIITRLIVKLNRQIDGNSFWRNGVVVRHEDARAVIIEDFAARQIRIDIEGLESKRELLGIIRRDLNDIHEDFHRRINYNQLVSCICNQCRKRIKRNQKPHYFNWLTIQKYARNRVNEIRCEESVENISIPELLDRIIECNSSLLGSSTRDGENEFHKGLASIIKIMTTNKEPAHQTIIHAHNSNIGAIQSGSSTIHDINQNIDENLNEVTRLIKTLKAQSQTFPDDEKTGAEIVIEDLESDLADEKKREPKRLTRRILALWGIACAIASGVASVADFSNNLLSLADYLNVEIPSELIQQNPHILDVLPGG
ncbi:MAG: COR domain-containing protein [Spirulinaceae cyanobacterium]